MWASIVRCPVLFVAKFFPVNKRWLQIVPNGAVPLPLPMCIVLHEDGYVLLVILEFALDLENPSKQNICDMC